MSNWVRIQSHEDNVRRRNWFGKLDREGRVALLVEINSLNGCIIRELVNKPSLSEFDGVDLNADSIDRRHIFDWDDPQISVSLQRHIEDLGSLLAIARGEFGADWGKQ